jgi:hypothetical protein
MTVRKAPLFLVAVVMAWVAVPAASAEIQFSIRDGRVVLVATNATIADIMAEWAKVGHTKIINADKIPRDVVTLELRDVSERKVLDILLRTTSGFIAALREEDDPNASLFDRIVIMPPSVAPPPQVNASAQPQNPRTASPAASMPVPEPAPAPVQVAAADDTKPDELPPQIVVEAALQERPAAGFTSNNTRHMMETLNPRDFRLPPSMQGAMVSPMQGAMVSPMQGTMVSPVGAVASPVVGSTRPGVISMPAAPTAR